MIRKMRLVVSMIRDLYRHRRYITKEYLADYLKCSIEFLRTGVSNVPQIHLMETTVELAILKQEQDLLNDSIDTQF